MPDLDIMERSLKKHWHGPSKQMRGHQPPQAVADSVSKALCATLREDEGIPAFAEILAAAMPADSGSGNARTLAEAIRALEMEFQQKRPVKVLAQAAQKYSAKVEVGRALPGPLSLAVEYLRSLVDHHLFSKVTGSLAGEDFVDIGAVRQYVAEIWSAMEPQLREVVRQLLDDPTAKNLRAPKSPQRRRTTAELLDEPLVRGNRRSGCG